MTETRTIYQRRLQHKAPCEGAPTLLRNVELTEEITGFALVETVWLDDEDYEKKLVRWFFGTQHWVRAQAIEYAVDHVRQISAEVEQ